MRATSIAALIMAGTTARPPAPGRVHAPLTVPFEFDRNQIVVTVRIGESGPLRFLLDTGTDPSVIDLATAYRLGLTLAPPQKGGAGAGTEEIVARRTTLMSMRVGGLVAGNIEAVAIDLAELSGRFGSRIDGVLGYSFLGSRIVEVDYRAREVRFPSPGEGSTGATGDTGRVVLPFESSPPRDRTPIVRALLIEGAGPFLASIDTGSSGNVALFHRAALGIGWKERIDSAKLSTASGYGGSFPSAQIAAASVALAGFDLGPMEITVPLPGANYEEGDPAREANIGNGVLSRFTLTFDYPGRRLIVEKVK